MSPTFVFKEDEKASETLGGEKDSRVEKDLRDT